MIDLSTISNTPIEVEEYKEPNLFQVPQPGEYDNCVVAGITRIDEYEAKDGQKYVSMTCDIADENGIMLTRNQRFNSQFRSGVWGDNDGNDLLDLCHSAGVTDGITDNNSLATAVRDVFANQNKFKVPTTWQGFSIDAYIKSIKDSTGSDIADEENIFKAASVLADQDQQKEARKLATYYVSRFKTNGDGRREDTLECEHTGAKVKAKSKVKLFVV